MDEKIVKKPAHEVIVEMVKYAVEVLRACCPTTRQSFFHGMLLAELTILERMIIPEKHREQVIHDLRQIKADCPPEIADQLLPETVFLNLVPINPIIKFFGQERNFLSDEGVALVMASERAVIKEAAKDNEVRKALVKMVDGGAGDPFFRRKLILVLSD